MTIRKVPLVVYRNNQRCVIGEAEINIETGLMTASITDQLFVENMGLDVAVEATFFHVMIQPAGPLSHSGDEEPENSTLIKGDIHLPLSNRNEQ